MLVFYFILHCTICLAVDKESISNPIDKDEGITSTADMDNNINIYHNNLDFNDHTESKSNNIVPWDTYFNVLIESSKKGLANIKKYIHQIDYFNKNHLSLLDELFADLSEHEFILRTNLRQINENDQFNDTKEFMMAFMEMSNFAFEKLVAHNLNKMKLITPTKWFSTMTDKVQRQELKAALQLTQCQICKLGICREKEYYTDYLDEWLRCLLNLDSKILRQFYSSIPDLLEKHKHRVKSNVHFKKTITNILNSDAEVQKDTLDFVDEILVNRETIFYAIPRSLKTASALLVELFKHVDSNYDVHNEDNKEELGNITRKICKVAYEPNLNVRKSIGKILDRIVHNMDMNVRIWPLRVQSLIYLTWTDVIQL